MNNTKLKKWQNPMTSLADGDQNLEAQGNPATVHLSVDQLQHREQPIVRKATACGRFLASGEGIDWKRQNFHGFGR